MMSRRSVLMTAQEKIATGLAYEDVKVHFRALIPNANVLTRVIGLPPLPEEIDDETEVNTRSWTGHEVGHLKYGSKPWPKDLLKDKVLKELAFGLEDCRTDRKMGEEFPGVKEDRRAGFDLVRPKLPADNVLQAAFFVLYEQVKEYHTLPDSAKFWAERLQEPQAAMVLAQMMMAVDKQIEKARHTKSTDDVLAVSAEIKEIWKKMFKSDSGQDGGEDGDSDEQSKMNDGGMFGEKKEQQDGEGKGKQQKSKKSKGSKDEDEDTESGSASDLDPEDWNEDDDQSNGGKQSNDEDDEDEESEANGGDEEEQDAEGGDEDEDGEESSSKASDGDEDEDGEESEGSSDGDEEDEDEDGEASKGDESEDEEDEDGESGSNGECDEDEDGEESDSSQGADEDEDADDESESGASGDEDEDEDESKGKAPEKSEEEVEQDMQDMMDDFKSVSDTEQSELENRLCKNLADQKYDYRTCPEGYRPFTGYDRVEEIVPQDAPASFRSDVKSKLGVMQRRLMMDLMSKRRIWVADREHGELDDTRLHRIPTGDKLVYKRKLRRPKLNIAVQVVLDMSGSMSGEKMWLCGQLGYILGETLALVRVPYEVVGFTTGYNSSASEPPVPGVYYHRTIPLRLIEIKPFSMTKRSDMLGRFYAAATFGGSGTVEGDAVWWAAKRLAVRSEQRKLLIVVCDGGPNGGPAPSWKFQEHAGSVVRRIRSYGIETIHVGIKTSAPLAYVPEDTFVQYNGLDDLLYGFYSQLGAILRGEKRRNAESVSA